MGKVQSLPFSHFQWTNAAWSDKDCIAAPKPAAQILNNLLTFWAVGPGGDITDAQTHATKYHLTQCFLCESSNYRRVRIVEPNSKNRIALLQHEHDAKKLGRIKPYGIYTYCPNYPDQQPHLERDVDAPLYLFGLLQAVQMQGYKWQYSVVQRNKSFKTLCYIQIQPRGHKYNCTYYQTMGDDEDDHSNNSNNNKLVIAQSLQPDNENRYNDWGEPSPISLAAGVDEVALLLIATALEDHRDKMNNAMRGKWATFVPSSSGYVPPLERTRDMRGFTQGFCS